MNKQLLLYVTLVSVAAIFLFSCQKDLQDKRIDGELSGTPLPGQQTYCRIESIWENPDGPTRDQRYVLILYDEYENPTAITTPWIGSDRPYHTFKYDSWHRLREWKGDEGNSNFEMWHFYGYDNSGRINVDTSYTLGGIDQHGQFYYFSRWINLIEYDNQNRISKVVTDVVPGNSHSETTYDYDAAGNLIYPASYGVTYDNKVSIYRTNDIWMFLHRDYSVNNRIGAVEYNPAGLPIKFNTPQSPTSPYFLNAARLDHSQISYGCRQAYW